MTDIDSPTEDELRSLDRAERLIREGVRGDSGLIAAMILEAVYEARDDEHSRRVGLEAENARLRAALDEINMASFPLERESVRVSCVPIGAWDNAMRALEGKDD